MTGSTYFYDADNHLIRALNPQTGADRAFGYDALDRCVWRQDNGGPKSYFLYDGQNRIEERDTNNARTFRYVHGGGIDAPLLLVRPDGSALYYHQDANNNVVALSDTAGNVVERYRYDPFGRPIVCDGAGTENRGDASAYGNRFLFTGREWQPVLKLYDYRARVYSPALGRFLQGDPIGFGGGNHLYRYCNNNPTNCTDPSGNEVALSGHGVSEAGYVADHAFLVITPSSPEVTAAAGQKAGSGPFTISGQPIDNDGITYLNSTYNSDQQYIGNQQQIVINPPKGMSQTDFELAIVNAANSYPNNQNLYVAAGNGGGYNSNGFVPAILNAVGLNGSKLLKKLPGWYPGRSNPPPLKKLPKPPPRLPEPFIPIVFPPDLGGGIPLPYQPTFTVTMIDNGGDGGPIPGAVPGYGDGGSGGFTVNQIRIGL